MPAGYSQPSSSRQTEPGRSSSSFLGPASSSGHYSSAPRGGSPSSSSSPARSDSPGADAPRGSAYAYGLGPGPAVRHAPSVGVGGVRAEEVIDRLTERLTDRLRVELRAELEVRKRSRESAIWRGGQSGGLQRMGCPLAKKKRRYPPHLPFADPINDRRNPSGPTEASTPLSERLPAPLAARASLGGGAGGGSERPHRGDFGVGGCVTHVPHLLRPDGAAGADSSLHVILWSFSQHHTATAPLPRHPD